jgi:hypothetical protein
MLVTVEFHRGNPAASVSNDQTRSRLAWIGHSMEQLMRKVERTFVARGVVVIGSSIPKTSELRKRMRGSLARVLDDSCLPLRGFVGPTEAGGKPCRLVAVGKVVSASPNVHG